MKSVAQHPTIESKLRDEATRILLNQGRGDIADIATQVQSPSEDMELSDVNIALIGVFESLEREGVVRRTSDAEYFINGYRRLGYKEEEIKLFIPYELV